jgi:hypothetical protein
MAGLRGGSAVTLLRVAYQPQSGGMFLLYLLAQERVG